jgi:hypothetical protein
MDPNSEPQLVLQINTPLTHWWHTFGPKQWATACAPNQDTTYWLMAHKWTQIVSHSLCSKPRHHLPADGTHGPKQWATAYTPNQDTTYFLVAHKWTQIVSHSLHSKARHYLRPDDTHMDPNSEQQLVLQSNTTYFLMTHKWSRTVSHSLCFKPRHHLHTDGRHMDPNSEPQLVLQTKTPLTSWWHTNGPKWWVTACTPNQDTTYKLMAHIWTQTVSHSLCSKLRHHLHSDGTRMAPNSEPHPVLQTQTPLTGWWPTNGSKQWATACASNQDTTYPLMAHKWTQTVSYSLCSRPRHHLHTDGTHMYPHIESQLVLQTKTPLTYWWHTNRPKQWVTACAPNQDTTYTLLMANKWTQTVSFNLCSKVRHHLHPDGTQMDSSSEPQLVLQTKIPLTLWWHTNGTKQWATVCAPKQDITY